MNNNEIKLNDIDFQNISDYKRDEIEEVTIKDIAIIGMDIRLPGIDGTDEFWGKLKEGINCITEFPIKRRKDVEEYLKYKGQDLAKIAYLKGGYLNEIDKFDYNFFRITPKEASLMNPIQRLFLEVAWKAIEDAGYGGKKIRSTSTGVYMGFISDLEGYKYRQIISDVKKNEGLEIAMAGNLSSITPSRISYLLDLKGPSLLIDTACSSSLVALHLACNGIRNGDCKQAIVGGINVNLFPLDNQIKIGMESSDGIARTFDDSCDGTGNGEGVVAILIKPLNDAIQDNDNIYAVIKSTAINQDGNSMGITAPNPLAQADVITKAWNDAGINPETISYMEAHGTGTVLGDPIEIDGINKAFSKYTDRKQFCAIGSVKTNVGHLYGAAGLVGVVKAALSLKNQQLPPINHFNLPNRKINFEESPVYINDRLAEWRTEGFGLRSGVSSFGFSGTNCHIVLEQAPELNKKRRDECTIPLIFTLSAKSKEALKRMIRIYVDMAINNEDLDYRDVCNTLCIGREHYKYRVAILVLNQNDFMDKIKRLDRVICTNFNELDKFFFYGESLNTSEIKENELKERYLKLETGKLAEAKSEISEILEDICQLYVEGLDIEWEKVYSIQNFYKVKLPSYSFERERCWVDIPGEDDNGQKKEVMLKGRNNENYSNTEKIIAQICKETLGFREIDINDNLLEIGGDSILLSKVYEKLKKRFPDKLAMAQIFVYPTIAKLSMYINSQYENNEKKSVENKSVDEELDNLFNELENGQISVDDMATKLSSI